MNILVLAHESPLPENHGFAQRVLSQARAMAHRGHFVWILAPSSDRDLKSPRKLTPDPGLEHLVVIEVPSKERMALPVRKLVGTLFPWQDSPGLLRQALKIKRKHGIDIVQLERPYLLRTARVLERLKVPIVLISHMVEQDAARDLEAMGEYDEKQVRAAVQAERDAVELADLTLAVSREDERKLIEYYGRSIGGLRPSIERIPNAIEMDRYEDVEPYKFRVPTVVFLGSGFHYPNRDAMWRLKNQIIPRVLRRHRTIQFVFIGPRPPEWLKPQPGVKVMGAVDDARQYVKGAAVCVAPLRYGSGTPIKMLEYMAAARAMVVSPHAARTFNLHDSEHAFIRSNADDYARAIVKIALDERLQRELGKAAYALAHEHYDWGVLAEQLEGKYERLLA